MEGAVDCILKARLAIAARPNFFKTAYLSNSYSLLGSNM